MPDDTGLVCPPAFAYFPVCLVLVCHPPGVAFYDLSCKGFDSLNTGKGF